MNANETSDRESEPEWRRFTIAKGLVPHPFLLQFHLNDRSGCKFYENKIVRLFSIESLSLSMRHCEWTAILQLLRSL